MNKLQLVWLEVEDEVFRARFALYIYYFAYVNGCIATSVVEARVCNLWDLGSSPSGTLWLLFFTCFTFLTFLAGRWASLGLAYFLFLIANPLFHLYVPGPIYFILFFIISFIFLNIFPKY